MTNQNTVKKNELKVKRTFNASPEEVYKMWTVPELFGKWYGPKGIIAEAEFDALSRPTMGP